MCDAQVLQVTNFDKAFVLATDASDVAVSAVLHQDVNGVLVPIAYHSRVFTATERKSSTYEECPAVLFGCEKCRPYLEHKEFLLQCDNLALYWLLRKTNYVGRMGRWILSLAPFKFKVQHSRGRDMVADALSRMFGEGFEENTQVSCAMLLKSLPVVYSSLAKHHAKGDYCAGINDRLQAKLHNSENFQWHKTLLCYYPRQAKRRRWIVPVSLRKMLIKYFHDSVFSGQLGAWKTYHKIASNFCWPKLCLEIFSYDRSCELCQRAKHAQDSGWVTFGEPCYRPY